MAKVRALTRVFVDNALRDEGEVFEYKGPFNRHLEYLDPVEPDEAQEPAAESEPVEEQAGKKWVPKAKRGAADKSSV